MAYKLDKRYVLKKIYIKQGQIETKMNIKEINKIKRFFSNLVKIMQKTHSYADVLLVKERSFSISSDKETIDVDTEEDSGVKLRIFDGEKFVEYAASGFDRHNLLENAKRLANAPVCGNIDLNINKTVLKKHFVQKGRIDPAHIALDQKVAFVKRLQKRILSFNKFITNAKILYTEENEFKVFVNSFRQLSQDITICFVAAMPFVSATDKSVRYTYECFIKPGYEVAEINDSVMDNFLKFTVAVREAKKIKPGEYMAILSPSLAGLLAHESFGHGMESDTLHKGRAKAVEFLGKRIAPKFVSIIDNPLYPAKNGSFFFDDEGQLPKATHLIKNGVINAQITELYSASQLKLNCSGNARAESYDHKTYARMSNTYFKVGDTKIEKIMKKVRNGVYLHNASGGMEDPKGWHVQIQGITAERIKNGKLTGEMFYEAGMTGYLPTILSNILAVGSQFRIPNGGRCGKGHKEWVRVSEGGPHLLIKNLHLS